MKNFLILIGGIGIGVGISWIYHKNKYEQLVEEEVESIREHMKKDDQPMDDVDLNNVDKVGRYPHRESSVDGTPYVENTINECHKVIKDNAYIPEEDIFVVTPENFASIPGYDADSLYYHNNDVISNDDNEEVDNVEELLGMTTLEIKNRFGQYEDNAVYIRNNLLHTDYEILIVDDDFEPSIGS